MSTKKEFQHHIHIFRGVAIMLIVCAHTVPSLDWSMNPLTGRIVDAIANQSSIFFFFIAGYLFQHLSARFHYKTYLKQKLKTVIVPYLILSVPALIIFTVVVPRVGMWPWFYDLPLWQQIGLFLLTGKHLAPLWFVPTISLFYLVAPLLIWIDRRATSLYWLIVPLLLLSTYVGRDGQYGPIDKAIYLLPVYLIGMVFSRYQSRAEALVVRSWLPLLIVMTVGTMGFFLEWPEPPYYMMIMKVPMTLLMTVTLLKYQHIFGKRLDYIAHVSFGIFFIHAYFISALKVATVYIVHGHLYTGEGTGDLPGTVPYFIVYALTVLLISVAVIRLAQKIFGQRSRMIIGA